MANRLIGLLITGFLFAGCQNKNFPEQGMAKDQWTQANPAAVQVYQDQQAEIWNRDQHCYYFMKDRLEYAYECGNLEAAD